MADVQQTRPPDCAIVLGTGRMAPGIALALAASGARVQIVGRSRERAEAAAARAGLEAVTAAPLSAGSFDDAHLVVETVVEDAAVKRALLARIEPWIASTCIVASNTSSLSIGELAGALERPERFAGLHFLNPAQHTGVVEVAAGPATSGAVVDSLVRLAAAMDKVPLVLRRDTPGFIWNRLQFAVLRECLHLLAEGVADVEAIDAAVSDGLAPRWLAAGPLATMDLGGADTFRRAAAELFPLLSAADAMPAEPAAFYRWSDESRAQVEALRAGALAAARPVVERRRRLTPPGT